MDGHNKSSLPKRRNFCIFQENRAGTKLFPSWATRILRSPCFHLCSPKHERTEKSYTASTSCCPIQSLRKVPCFFALYGTTGGTCSARFFRPVMYAKNYACSAGYIYQRNAVKYLMSFCGLACEIVRRKVVAQTISFSNVG